jgi:lipoprotein-releasing system permease protein
MSYEFFIGRRYLRAKQKERFISVITLLSIAGVSVGVMALIVVIAVMTGFESDLKSRILKGQAHGLVMRHGGPFKNYNQVVEKIKTVDGVVAATPFIYMQVMIRSSGGVSGAVLRGVDPKTAGQVIQNLDHLSFGQTQADAGTDIKTPPMPGIVLGRELAVNLGVTKGDSVYLITPRGMMSPIGHVPGMKRFQVTGFFESGMYEYDGTFAYIRLKDAQQTLRMKDAVTGIEVRVKNLYKADTVTRGIVSVLGFPFWARDWMQMNKNLFTALKLEKTVMFVILTLIVLVAAFNIASTLIMTVMEKTRDIAILKAMGATDRSIRKIFVFKGIVIGAVGTFLGVLFGFGVCTVLKYYKIVELTGDIYYFTTTLPVRMEMLDVFAIVVATMLICFLATLYPARQASKLNPVEAIRYG